MGIIEFAILGLGSGAIYAVLGQSIVVVSLGSKVLNFASGAIGMIGAYLFFKLRDQGTLPMALALVVALAFVACIGIAAHVVIFRRLSRASTASRIVATLGLLTVLIQVISMTWASGQGGGAQVEASPLPTGQISIGSNLTVGVDQLITAGIAVVVTGLLVLAQRRTRLGLAMTAVSENQLVTSSMGWSPNAMGALTWALGSMLAAIAIILVVPLTGLDPQSLTLLVVPAMAAALLGNFNSFPLTLLGGMAIGIGESEIGRYVTAPGWSVAAPLLAIVVVLALRGRALPGRGEASERRPSVGTGRLRIAVLVATIIGVVLVVAVPVTWLTSLTSTAIFGLLLLSFVVLTGYAGQLSLAQLAIAGLAGYLTAEFAIAAGLPLVLAAVLAVLACTPVGLVIAIPALRTRGANLAIATLSLAVAIDSLVISNPDRISSLAGMSLGRFNIFGLDLSTLDHPTGYAIAVLVVFVLVGLAVANLRRGKSGRRLLAVRSNERAAASMGISVVGAKLYAFWLGTMIAATAGVLMEAQSSVANLTIYPVFSNLTAVLGITIGGVGWILGAVVGSFTTPGSVLGQALTPVFSDVADWLTLVVGVLAIVTVVTSPDGIVPFWAAGLRRIADVYRRRYPSRLKKSDGHFRRPVVPAVDTETSENRSLSKHANQVLAVERVSVSFGSQQALNDVTLRVESGEIVGLIGPNGAGKSTLIDVITGFQKQDRGVIRLGEDSVNRSSPAKRARLGLSRSFQNLELFEDLTVLENLHAAAERISPWDYLFDLVWPRKSKMTKGTQAAIREFRLEQFLDQLPRELDFGKRRLVAIARALGSDPPFLLLDEPAAGLDERERRELADLIRRVAAQWGIGVLLVDHDVQMVLSVCQRVVVLDAGEVICTGSPDQVRTDAAVRIAYLGVPVDATEGANLPPSRIVTSTSLLHLRDVSAGYGGVPVVQHLDIEVKAGEIVTLLGANGAGKTTILHTIAGVLRPISGEVHSSGSRLTGALHTRARGGLALVTEERAVIHQLSVIDNLRLGTRQVDEAFRLFPNLKLIQHRRAGLLSGGEQQMLVLARVLANKARLLLVDELSFGLAPLIVQSLLGTLREAADGGCGVLLVEQHPSLALSVADRGYVIGKGKVQLEGSSSDLLAQLNEIEATYLSA